MVTASIEPHHTEVKCASVLLATRSKGMPSTCSVRIARLLGLEVYLAVSKLPKLSSQNHMGSDAARNSAWNGAYRKAGRVTFHPRFTMHGNLNGTARFAGMYCHTHRCLYFTAIIVNLLYWLLTSILHVQLPRAAPRWYSAARLEPVESGPEY